MASTSSNKMDIPSPDWNLLQVDYDKVNRYIFDRLTYPPSTFTNRQGHTIFANVNQNQISEHTLHHRPYPCSIDKYRFFHPEFFLKNGHIIWTPRQWGCHAYQGKYGSLRSDHCQQPACRQLHRPGFLHCELVAYRGWATTTPARGSQFFCCDLYVARYQDVQFCLTHQPFITREVQDKRAWKGQSSGCPELWWDVRWSPRCFWLGWRGCDGGYQSCGTSPSRSHGTLVLYSFTWCLRWYTPSCPTACRASFASRVCPCFKFFTCCWTKGAPKSYRDFGRAASFTWLFPDFGWKCVAVQGRMQSEGSSVRASLSKQDF